MQISDIFIGLGQDNFSQLIRTVSLGRLKTYQLFERVKARMHLQKLNTEALRKAVPRTWQRINEPDEEFAVEMSQAILVSNIDLIKAVLDYLGVPHDEGFFMKDIDTSQYLTEGWMQRVWDHFKDSQSQPVLLFYINHLALEAQKIDNLYQPA